MINYCDVCDKTINLQSKGNHFQSLTHIEYENSIPLYHTIKNPNFFDTDKKFAD